jgi:hypothetical protein
LVTGENAVRIDFWFESFPAGAFWHRQAAPCPFVDSRRKVYPPD